MRRRILFLAFAVALAMVCAAIAGASGTGESTAKPVTLKIMTEANPGEDMNNDPVTALTEKLTGYNLEFQMLPTDPAQRQQKLNLMLSSGDVVDIIKLSSIDMAKQMIPQGYFVALDDLLKQAGPNILKNTAAKWFTPVLWQGKTYGIPVKRTAPADIVGSIYRKDLFKTAGVAVPTTTKEFRDALVTLKSKTGLIPYTACGSFPVVDTISSAFGICQSAWYKLDGKIVPRVKMPGYAEYLKYMAGLVKDGLLDREMPANTDESTQRKMSSGQAAASWWAWWWWPANDAVRQNAGAEIGFLPPLHSDAGQGMAWLWGSTPEWVTVIPKDSKHQKDAVAFLDSVCKDENFNQIFLGTEGQHYQKDGDSYVALPLFTKEKSSAWVMLMVTNDKFREKFQSISQSGEDPKRDVLFTYAGMKNAAEKYAVADPTEALPAPTASGKYANALAQLENEFTVQVISGTKSVSEYQDFITQWNEQGGAELEAAWNAAYSAK
jgi:putative aldouronate transport system substrate-binding protein